MKEDTSEVKVVKNVSISILDAKKLTNLLSFVNKFEGKFNYSIHIDVMDNKTVVNRIKNNNVFLVLIFL